MQDAPDVLAECILEGSVKVYEKTNELRPRLGRKRVSYDKHYACHLRDKGITAVHQQIQQITYPIEALHPFLIILRDYQRMYEFTHRQNIQRVGIRMIEGNSFYLRKYHIYDNERADIYGDD